MSRWSPSVLILAPTTLKRSFDVEDAEDVAAFPASSPPRSPLTPSPPGAILAAGTGEGRRVGGPLQPSYQSRISLSPSPTHSPVLKARISSSLSFNRGTIHLPRANGTSLTRVSSFQTRLNPNGFSSSLGPGSDNESLHSSSSSLECPTPVRGPLSPSPRQSVPPRIGASQLSSPLLKKFSSHSNVFHAEADRPIQQGAKATPNHSSLPSLDLHIAEDQGGGPVLCSTPRGAPAPVRGSQDENCILPLPRSVRKEAPLPPLETGPLANVGPPSAICRQTVKLQKFPICLDGLMGKPPGGATPGPAADSALKALPRIQLSRNACSGLTQQLPEDAAALVGGAPTLPPAGRLPGVAASEGSTPQATPSGPAPQPQAVPVTPQMSSVGCPALVPLQRPPATPGPREPSSATPETPGSALDQEASKPRAPAPDLSPRDDLLVGPDQLLTVSCVEDAQGSDLWREGRWRGG
ncbi:hypothetical protein lerEdw1_018397 [Lerista edwardsae]|nr:hypothetical protein lerEdw1_018397 [Lerista edwardsae]